MPFIEIEKGQIHYQILNQEMYGTEKPIVVFLHEGLGSIPQWKTFPLKLASKLNLPALLYERIGYGKSSEIQENRDSAYLERYAFEELPQILKLLNITQPLILVGHSDGASIALLHASKYRPLTVISIAAHVFVEQVTIDGIEKAIQKKEKIVRALTRYHGTKTNKTFDSWAKTWTNPMFFDWNIEHYLKNVECLNLVIQGVDDQYGTESQVDSIVLNTLGKSIKYMMPNCGHSPHIEEESKLIDILFDFISSEIFSDLDNKKSLVF